MDKKLKVAKLESTQQTEEVIVSGDKVQEQPVSLQEVVQRIRTDCQIAPRQYVDELHIPGGGE